MRFACIDFLHISSYLCTNHIDKYKTNENRQLPYRFCRSFTKQTSNPMATDTRIPRNYREYNSYIIGTSSYLQEGTPITHATRLGLLDGEDVRWIEFAARWRQAYFLYNDKKNSRTTAIIDEMRSIINDTVNYDRKTNFLEKIAASPNVTTADLTLFNIKKGSLRKKGCTIPNTPIVELVSPALQPLSGGFVSIRCHNNTKRRAAIYGSANCVQYRYMVGTTPPLSAKAGELTMNISTKASFVLQLEPSSTGKYLYIYFRWHNTKHPILAGPWSTLQTSLIL